MSLTSWFSAPQLHGDPALSKRNRPSRRRPTRSRPCLEGLEERTLLDASSGLIGGASNNLTLNSNFNLASTGNVLPIPTNGYQAVVDSATGNAAAASAFLAQDQLNSQFLLFGINSQGDDQMLVEQTTASILRDAFGFGTGTQPNAPWLPNSYNLGLVNHQFNYSSQTDLGFSSVPPWGH